MHKITLIALALLVGLSQAGDDAVILPSQGVTAAPVVERAIGKTDEITIPRLLSYQGKLTDTLGNPVPDGYYQLTFRLYSQETGGTPLWVEPQTIPVKNGIFSTLLGSVVPIPALPDAGTLYLSLQVGLAPELSPRLRIGSAAYAFLAERSANSDLLQGRDTSYFARATHTHAYVDSAGGAQRVGGLDLSGLDERYVEAGEADAITSGMIADGTIERGDVAADFKAPYADTADYAASAGDAQTLQGMEPDDFAAADHSHPYVDSAGGAERVGGLDLSGLDERYVEAGEADAITSGMIADGAVTMAKINQAGASAGQVLKWNGSAWAPAADLNDDAWVRDSNQDSVLFTARQLGIARGNADNVLYGALRYTHVNFGVACTTGNSSFDVAYSTVGGGVNNVASAAAATVAGGENNRAAGYMAVVAGGYANRAGGTYASIGGGSNNVSNGNYAAVPGGRDNVASGDYSIVAGGMSDTAAANYSFAGGYNTRVRASADYTFAFGEGCSTSTPRAVVFYHSGGTTKLGIGVQNPQYPIHVQGGAYCDGTSWVDASSRLLKKDIRALTPEEVKAILEELKRIQVVRFRYKSDVTGEEHIGVIAEDVPELLATPNRDGINTGDAIGFLLAAIQAVCEQNQELRQELEALKAQLQEGR
ncbi:MAG: tail fiber domain-containing protein [candidate division WOR-3 bacterium]